MVVFLSNVMDLDCFEDHYSLLQCRSCDLIHSDPYPTEAMIGKLYAEGKSTDYEFPERGLIGRLKDLVAQRQVRRIGRLAKIRPRKILDFGTGAGRFAAAATGAYRTAEVVGADFAASPPLGSYYERGLAGLRYLDYNTLRNSGDRFDLILARHVLEHTHDPVGMARSWLNLLAPNGVLYVEVPNANSRTARILPKRWPLWYVPKHLTHFTRRTLPMILEAAGGQIDVGRCELPMMGNVLALLAGRSRFDGLFKLPGILLHPLQLALEGIGGESTCLYAIVRCSNAEGLKQASSSLATA